MNRRRWQDREGHPPSDLLLLHLENELKDRDADTVRTHLTECATCRMTCDQLERGMSRFTAFATVQFCQRRRLNKSSPRTPPCGSNRECVDSYRHLASSLFAFDSPRRLAFVLGGVSICLIVWSFAFLGSPRQSVYASQILDDARKASDSFIGHSKTLNQKILLRRGNLVIERSVHHGRQPHVQARESTIDAQLQKELYLAHINLNDPLNANDFADWRAAQQEYTDSVKENHQNVTITTRVAGTAITEGSLTLSRSGWRPVARSVEFRGEVPIEISEVSYDISDSPSLIAESAASSSLPTASTATNAPAAADEVSTVDLEISELDLREALHSIGADVSATPEIWRSEHTVFFRAFPENPMQLQTIEEAVDRIPHVKEAREKSERISGAPQTAHGVTPYTTTPPLANALEAKLAARRRQGTFLIH